MTIENIFDMNKGANAKNFADLKAPPARRVGGPTLRPGVSPKEVQYAQQTLQEQARQHSAANTAPPTQRRHPSSACSPTPPPTALPSTALTRTYYAHSTQTLHPPTPPTHCTHPPHSTYSYLPTPPTHTSALHLQFTEKYSRITDAFKFIDADRTGYLERAEVKRLLVEFNVPDIKDEAIETLIDFADYDGDGVINYAEFARVLTAEDVMRMKDTLAGNVDH